LEIEEIHEKAAKFVKEHFHDLRPDAERITTLSVMKMLVDLEKMKQTTKYFENALKISPEILKKIVESRSPTE